VRSALYKQLSQPDSDRVVLIPEGLVKSAMMEENSAEEISDQVAVWMISVICFDREIFTY
jgi:hypothetical protein